MAATAFQTQQSLARNLVLSVKTQTTVGTALADASLTRRARFNASGALERKISMRNDKQSAGKGTEFATSSTITQYDTSFTFKDDLDDWLIGFLMCHACGQDIVTGAGPYTHAFGFNEAFDTQAPMTTFYMEDTNDLKRNVVDMSMTDLTLTIPETGPITFESMWVGTGRVIAHTIGALPAVPAPIYLLSSDCEFLFGPTGAPVDVTGRLQSATIKISTGASTWHCPGDQGYGVFNRTDLRRFSVSAVIAAKDTDDIEGNMVDGTLSAMEFNINAGASAQLNIGIPNFMMKSAKLSTQGNLTYWQVDADETTIMPTGGGDGPLDITVINSVAQYLAAA